MNDPIEFIKSFIDLNIETGPYITGSYMTWLLEKKIGYNPQWIPDDLDICCTSEEQFSTIKHYLEPQATVVNATNWLGKSGCYWTVGDFKYQAFVHPITVNQRLYCVDFTMGAIASDGDRFITNQNTMHDILNKVIRLNDKILDWPRPIESITGRYYKYLNRGYSDLNNEALNKLNQLYETRTTF